MEGTSYKPKGFFEKPEGKTGMLFIVVGVFGILLFGNTLMPYIISALQNTIHAAILGGIVIGAIALAMNEKFRLVCSNLFKSGMRFITGLIVTIDPIGILKNYIEDMGKQIGSMEEQIAILRGQEQKLKRTIEERKEIAEHAAMMAKAAHEQGNQDQFTVESRKLARAKEFVDKMMIVLNKMDMIYKVLDKMKRNVALLLEDTKDEVSTREVEYRSITAAHKAMSSAKRLITGDAAKELFDQAMEFLANDISNKIGEMERAMDASRDFMESVDLQNGVWDEKGLQILEKLEQGGSIFAYENTKSEQPGLTSNYITNNSNPPLNTSFASFFTKEPVKVIASKPLANAREVK